MKKLITISFAAAMLFVLAGNASYAQSDDVAVAAPSAMMSSSASVKNAAAVAPANVNPKVARAFYREFRTLDNVQWKETKTEYIAEFKAGDRLGIAWFNKGGRLYSTNFYGTAAHLPREERALIARTFPEYEITATTEVTVQNSNAWVVSIRSGDFVKKVKIADGTYEVMETMNRAR